MSKETHTGGPWFTEPRIGEKQGDESTIIRNDNEIIAWVHGYVDHPGNAANARLIAAAPDLLAFAMAHDAYMLDAGYSGPDSDALHPKAAANWRACRAALSRAKGPSA